MASNTARGFICKCPAVGSAPGARWGGGGLTPGPCAAHRAPCTSGLALCLCRPEGSTTLIFLETVSVVPKVYS